jgi:hypothetical protein
MLHVALKVPLSFFALAGSSQRHDLTQARTDGLRNALDRAAFTSSVAPLEQHDDLQALALHPRCQLDQLRLQVQQLALVDPHVELAFSGL